MVQVNETFEKFCSLCAEPCSLVRIEACKRGAVEAAPSATHNSDYAAALQDLKMFIHGRLQVHPELQCELGFIWERLNALKAEHLA